MCARAMNVQLRTVQTVFSCFLVLVCLAGCSGKDESPLFFESKRKAGEAEAPVKDVPTDLLSTQKAFSEVARKVTPCVVNISTISKKKLVQPFFEMNPFFEDFFSTPPNQAG